MDDNKLESGSINSSSSTNAQQNGDEEKPELKTEKSPLLQNFGETPKKRKWKEKTPSQKRAERSLVIATIFTLFFMIGEIVGGYLAGSLAIMTDAAHLLTDVAAMLLSLFAMTLSRRPADDAMTFGYHRAEILGALASIITIWALVGVLCYEAILRLKSDAHLVGDVVDGRIMTAIGCAGLAVNIIDAIILKWGNAPHGHAHGHSHGHKEKGKKSKKDEKSVGHKKKNKKKEGGNVNVRAAFIHVIGGIVYLPFNIPDCLQSVGVIIAALVVWIGNYVQFHQIRVKQSWWNLADPIASLLFGVITLITTLTLLRQIVDVLMERVPKDIDYNAIKAELKEIPGVTGVHDLHIWCLSIGKVSLSAHISSDEPAQALRDAEKIIRSHGISHSTIQVDPAHQIEDVTCAQVGDLH